MNRKLMLPALLALFICQKTMPGTDCTSVLNTVPAVAAMGLEFAEIPADSTNADWEYHCHASLPSNEELRNYSFCFDRLRHCSMWVAWPLHSVWMGDASRTNRFGYDPVFVQDSDEAEIGKYAYYPQGGSCFSHARGHQLPSADRTGSEEDNRTTFYATNMTPQLQSLNGGVWEKLEEMERKWCSDTLYIISGPIFDDSEPAEYAYDSKGLGKACQIPSWYWKVMLRVKDGVEQKDVSKCDSSEIQCIGFLFRHDGKRTDKAILPDDIRSVSEIEEISGFTFYVNVPNAPKCEYDISDWPGL